MRSERNNEREENSEVIGKVGEIADRENTCMSEERRERKGYGKSGRSEENR